MKTTLVVGASTNPSRYSFMAVELLKKYGHPVIACGMKTGSIQNTPIVTEYPKKLDVDTVTIYVNPKNQSKEFMTEILKLNPRRIIFNPGAENDLFEQHALENGIEVENACTLVLLQTGQY